MKTSTSKTIAQWHKESIVIYESAVIPDRTGEVCVPVHKAQSGLLTGTDFEVGYSP